MAGEKCAGAAITRCELCGGVAAVHCEADSAFLCASCDARVHGANFLASRHLRRPLVAVADDEDVESDLGSVDSDSSSSCVSTADSCAPTQRAAAVKGKRMGAGKKRRARAEVVLEGWAKRMGLAPGAARRRAARASAALQALGRGVTASRVPLRVAMAAALWSEVAGSGSGCVEAALLRRLEASAHVPARLVVAVASWMARAAGRAAAPVEEGWAECS